VQTIKKELVGLMISSPPTIQTQLGEAISIIADSDFWERWDTLTKVRFWRAGGRPAEPKLICWHRTLSTVSLIPITKSQTACWRLHTPSSCGGGPYFNPMSSTEKFYMSSVPLANPSSSC
jgi:hypothetical protein